METRLRTATHMLEEISWLHVRASNGDQEAHGNSQSGRDAMAACQRFQWGPGAHGNSLSRYWMDCFFVVNLKILHVTCLLPMLHSEFAFLSHEKILPFSPYHSH